jgi:hypothetical protein
MNECSTVRSAALEYVQIPPPSAEPPFPLPYLPVVPIAAFPVILELMTVREVDSE